MSKPVHQNQKLRLFGSRFGFYIQMILFGLSEMFLIPPIKIMQKLNVFNVPEH